MTTWVMCNDVLIVQPVGFRLIYYLSYLLSVLFIIRLISSIILVCL